MIRVDSAATSPDEKWTIKRIYIEIRLSLICLAFGIRPGSESLSEKLEFGSKHKPRLSYLLSQNSLDPSPGN
ncbi:hypothetical protein NC652_025042 [Populus alba x Populus x berolinensis]|nr:hypothetical protein NC652_025042 [Populus alba x Populus x berolinensis]